MRFFLLLILYANFSLVASETNQTSIVKIDSIENEIKSLKYETKNLNWKLETSTNNLDNRIESFGNYLDIFNSRIEIALTLFGIIITVLLIYLGFKAAKESKLIAKDEAEKAVEEWIKKNAKTLIEKKTKKIYKNVNKQILEEEKSKSIFNLLNSYESQIILEEPDIEISSSKKKELANKARRSKSKAYKDRSFFDWLQIIFNSIVNRKYKETKKLISLVIDQVKLNKMELSRLYYLKAFTLDKMLSKDNKKEFQNEIIKLYKKSIDLDPSYLASHRGLGLFYSNVTEDYPKAKKEFKEIITKNKNDYKAYNSLGIVNRRIYSRDKEEKHFKKALKCYKKAIKLNPDDRRAYNNIGYLFLITSQRNEEKKKLEKLLGKNLIDEAEKYFTKSIEIDPDFSAVAYNNQININLIHKNGYWDEELAQKYEKKFYKKKLDSYANYEVYKLLAKICNNEEYETLLNDWLNRNGQKVFRQFYFEPLIKWANVQNDQVKNKLLTTIDILKPHYIGVK